MHRQAAQRGGDQRHRVGVAVRSDACSADRRPGHDEPAPAPRGRPRPCPASTSRYMLLACTRVSQARARGSGRRCGGSCRARCRAADARAPSAARSATAPSAAGARCSTGMRPARRQRRAAAGSPSTLAMVRPGDTPSVLSHARCSCTTSQTRMYVAGLARRADARRHRDVVAGRDRLRETASAVRRTARLLRCRSQPVIRHREQRAVATNPTSGGRCSTSVTGTSLSLPGCNVSRWRARCRWRRTSPANLRCSCA